MATTVSVSLHAEPERLADVFVALTDRMFARSAVSKTLLHQKYWYRKADEISENRLRTQTRSLVDSIRDSDQALEVQLSYQLLSERRMALDLLLYGARYEDGLAAGMNGRIQLRASHNDLARPLRSLLAQDEQHRGVDEFAQAGVSVLTDAEEIFFRACGVLESEPPNAACEHAGMYLEAGWPSPAGSSMVFHRHVNEFAKDFARIYAEYNLGIHMPSMLSSDFDPSRLNGKKLAQPNLEFYRQFSRLNSDDILAFLDGLSQEKSRELSTFSSHEIRSLLNTVSQKVPDVECHDFADRGLALTTNPLSSVWRAYKYVQNQIARP